MTNRMITSIVVANLQDNRAVFRIFIALLKFSFDFPSYNFNCYGVIVTQLLWKCDLDTNTNSRADAKHV